MDLSKPQELGLTNLELLFLPSILNPVSVIPPFVYSGSTTVVYMLVYVDDIIVTGNNPTFINLSYINSILSPLKDLGDLDYFWELRSALKLMNFLYLLNQSTLETYWKRLLWMKPIHFLILWLVAVSQLVQDMNPFQIPLSIDLLWVLSNMLQLRGQR